MKTNVLSIFVILCSLAVNFYLGKSKPESHYRISETPQSENSTFPPAQAIHNTAHFASSGPSLLFPVEDLTLTIGTNSEFPVDNPIDNKITFVIPESFSSQQTVYLEYDLYGFADFQSVSRNINDHLAIGGQIIQLNNEWTHQSEMIPAYQLKTGVNQILFNIPDGLNTCYQLKNVRIRFGENANNNIVISNRSQCKNFGRYTYISGFLLNPSDGNVKVMANETQLRYHDGSFEGLVETDQLEEILVNVFFSNGDFESTIIHLTGGSEYNYIFNQGSTVAFAKQVVNGLSPFTISLDAMRLDAEMGSVTGETEVSVTGLRQIDMHLLPASMVNVTAMHDGYRCLPHGSFKKDIRIYLQYNPASIPAGYGPEDIRTFFYDETTKAWVMLEPDSIDIANNVIISKTNHFTDFINAILKTPEMPQSQAFTPTSLKDMAYADPMAGMNIISPPVANNNGTTNLSFPLQLPQGRNGMQPQLTITYSSDAGNSWLGVGWNLQTPAITLDTRWGVPRYSSSSETEEYLVNGEQLVELEILTNDTIRHLLVHMGAFRSRNMSGETFFSYRIEGAFHKIVRHGTSPLNYWWEVIDKQGTHYYYGKKSSDAGVNPLYVLNDASGNIAHWALAEVRDVHGNYILYEYTIVTQTSGPGTGGKQMYPLKITYTGFDTTDGLYTVDFTLKNRTDITTSGRNGFLETNSKLLNDIVIKYDNQFIRKYFLKHEPGAFYKTNLIAIADITDPLFSEEFINCDNMQHYPGAQIHCFDYYKEDDISFEAQVTSFVLQEIAETFFSGVYSSPVQSIGKSRGTNVTLGGTLAFGFGVNVLSKKNTLGINMTGTLGTVKEKVQLIDINGDGISDKIVRQGQNFFVYIGSLNSNNVVVFDQTAQVISGLPNLGVNWSKSWSIGGELLFSLANLSGKASYSRNWGTQIVTGYFSDVNGDGYIDYVKDGTEYFNFPDAVTDQPVFTMRNSNPVVTFPEDDCYSIIYDGTMDPDFEESEDEDNYNYMRDPVRMWIAPADGKMIVENHIQRINPSALNETLYFVIQHNNTVIVCDSIDAQDVSLHSSDYCFDVFKNDVIYFRLFAKNGSEAEDVYWDNVIYSNSRRCLPLPPKFDADEKSVYKFRYSDDAIIHDKQYFIAPFTGEIEITADIASPAQSDNLQYVIKHNTTNLYTNTYTNAQAFSHSYSQTAYPVNEGDSIMFKLVSNTNVNWNDIDFDAHIQYSKIGTTTISTTDPYYDVSYYPSLHMSMYPKIVRYSNPVVLAAGNYTVSPQLVFTSIGGAPTGYVYFTAKTTRGLLDKKYLYVQNGVLSPSQNLQFSLPASTTVYFDYYTTNTDLSDKLTSASYVIGGVPSSSGFFSVYPADMAVYGNLYRGWGQFSYLDNASPVNCNLAINTNNVDIDLSFIDENVWDDFPLSSINNNWTYDDVTDQFDLLGLPDIETIPMVPMFADRKNDKWIDFCQSAYSERENAGTANLFGQLYAMTTDMTIFEQDDQPVPDFNNPIPVSNLSGTEVIAPNKKTLQSGWAFSWGVLLSNPMSNVKSGTTTKGVLDFYDMNGDRYPDIVGSEKIQYSKPQGGLSSATHSISPEIFTCYGSGITSGVSFGVKNILLSNGKSMATLGSALAKANNIKGSFGVGVNNGESNQDYLYIDMNGDGLPDRINAPSNTIEYNLGYDYSGTEPYQITMISVNNSLSGTLNLSAISSVNKDEFSWSAGIGGSASLSNDKKTMFDINNDGLTDICYVYDNKLYAFINTGCNLNDKLLNNDYDNDLQYLESDNVGANISGTLGFSFLGIKITGSLYLDVSFHNTTDLYKLTDMNGDGAIDFVVVDNGSINCQYGIPKKTNILKQVVTPSKSIYTFDYTMDYPNRDNPQAKWVLSSLKVYDGFTGDGSDYVYYQYEYENPKYHRMERESFGYEIVRTKQYNGEDQYATCYRTTEEGYHNNYFLFKGLKKYDFNYRGDNSNLRYVETNYTWERKEISTGTVVPESLAVCFGPYYPAISVEDRYFYEGHSIYSIHTRKTWDHGPYGNIKQYINYNDMADNTDDLRANISYDYDLTYHFLEMIDELNVFNYQNQLLQKRIASYNTFGNISQIGMFDGTAYAYVDLAYDQYGNINSIEYPADINNDRLTYSYVYDSYVHTYPVTITDFWGNVSSTDYNFKFGLPTKIIDPSGNEMHFTYYADGKPEKVIGPNEILASVPFTIYFDYWTNYGSSPGSERWALTRHYDPLNTGNEFITSTISDAMGRPVQTKKTATVNGTDEVIISGRVNYDEYWRAVSVSHPSTESYTPAGMKTFTNYTPTNLTTVANDTLDRPLSETAPDNTTVLFDYDFGNDAFQKVCFKTVITDPNSITTTQFTDARGLQTSVTAPLNTITKFKYSSLGQLTESTDPESNITYYTYDMPGRLIARNHPDAGITSYTYDMAGNVLTTQTANLDAIADYIDYIYDDCRLVQISYPVNPEMNVYYQYGASNTGNQSGRLIAQQDASGMQTFEYGNMGELIENIHTFVVPGGDAYTFQTKWDYDSWNRLIGIYYPDGEYVSYFYDNGGKLIAMSGVKNSITYDYIDDVKYDKFGSRTRIDYGNGTYSLYTYHPQNRRLTNLQSYEMSTLQMHDLNYYYDNAGNIIGLGNYGDYVNGNTGGVFEKSYDYDDLYRLTTSDGYFCSYNNNYRQFDLEMSYSPSGNIVSKTQNAQTLINGNQVLISYDNDYYYYGKPHAVSVAGNYPFKWDLNGNMIARGISGGERYQCWDEENRLAAVRDVAELSQLSVYLYDGGGERAWKLTGQEMETKLSGKTVYTNVSFDKTLYSSPLMVVTDQEYTKHYFIEGERVCTKIGGGFWGTAPFMPDSTPVGMLYGTLPEFTYHLSVMTGRHIDCTGYDGQWDISPSFAHLLNKTNMPESNQYFYHSDHLGSASFVTDATGYVDQHIQYLPFGELFISQRNSTFDSRYKFTAKELDNETQYTYFGARYYDSDISIWLSPDPLADKHPDYTPYAYCYNNPVVYVDPFGLDTVLFNQKGNFQTPLPGGDENTDTYVRVSDKEFERNKINYNKKGELKGRHKNIQINKDFRESMKKNGDSYIYEAGGYSESKTIFEFFAKNTIVEWAHLIYQDLNNMDITCEISTDHKEGEVTYNTPTDLKKGSYTLVDLRHSHPDGWISGTDRYTHQYYNSKGPVRSYVLKYGQYFQYNGERGSNEKYAVEPKSYK